MIYLDNASTTPVDQEVFDAALPYMKDQFGNPGTLYGLGRDAKTAIDLARKQVADFICAEPRQIIFTSSGTEANNMVFFSMAEHLKKNRKTHIVASAVEHDSVLKSIREMCTKYGFDYTVVGVDKNGYVNPEDVRAAIKKNTGLVSIMYMNNETGSINDVKMISEICKEKAVYFHTDCIQAAGCCDLNVNEIGCHFLSISSHKIYGMKGAGALYASADVLSPMIFGGTSQEFGLRGGTENVPAIVGFGKACELMKANLCHIRLHTTILKQLFYGSLKRELKKHSLDNLLHVNGATEKQCGKTLNIRFDRIDGETLLLLLDGKGVCVSAGSACRSHESEPSHVLLAMGIEPDDARNSIRVSFSKFNTTYEIEKAASIIAETVAFLHEYRA